MNSSEELSCVQLLRNIGTNTNKAVTSSLYWALLEVHLLAFSAHTTSQPKFFTLQTKLFPREKKVVWISCKSCLYNRKLQYPLFLYVWGRLEQLKTCQNISLHFFHLLIINGLNSCIYIFIFMCYVYIWVCCF